MWYYKRELVWLLTFYGVGVWAICNSPPIMKSFARGHKQLPNYVKYVFVFICVHDEHRSQINDIIPKERCSSKSAHTPKCLDCTFDHTRVLVCSSRRDSLEEIKHIIVRCHTCLTVEKLHAQFFSQRRYVAWTDTEHQISEKKNGDTGKRWPLGVSVLNSKEKPDPNPRSDSRSDPSPTRNLTQTKPSLLTEPSRVFHLITSNIGRQC